MGYRIVRVGKKGIRALGIAESFRREIGGKAVLSGIVQRSDGILDGIVLGTCTVGGLDSTDKILDMWERLGRDDVNVIMLSGCVISWFNIVDLPRLYRNISIPLICLTYRESKGLTEVLKRRFPEDWEKRSSIYQSNGDRSPILLKTGFKVYVRFLGLDEDDCRSVLDKFMMHGRYPEPVRIAKMVARSVLDFIR
jgi:endonuclease V-like protein UPF0215 family